MRCHGHVLRDLTVRAIERAIEHPAQRRVVIFCRLSHEEKTTHLLMLADARSIERLRLREQRHDA
jgi:hypothetical protein